MRQRILLAVAIIGVIGIVGDHAAHAQFFEDNFASGKARTDFESTTEGTASNPLRMGSCYYNNPNDPILIRVHPTQTCPTGPTIYSQSNGWDHNSGRLSSTYWVTHANHERSFSTANTGPPGQSATIGP